jgi:hypothetical protein
MGLTVVWEAEDGTSIGTVEDPSNLLHRLLPGPEDNSFQILRFIDWYSDTVINRRQLEPFLQEWDRLAQGAKTEAEKALVLQIREFATKCQQQQHTSLKFYGD